MKSVTLTFQNDSFILELVLFGIVIFALTALTFFFLTFSLKLKRIKKEKLKKQYQEIIEELLFEFLFETREIKEILDHPNFRKNFHSLIFQRCAIKAVVSLNSNYSGDYSRKLEKFFAESGLADYSLKKLNSQKRRHIIEGVRDLSSMNYQTAFSRIVSQITNPNISVKTEVILGMIKMRGIEEILKFEKYDLYLNDWVHSNILYTVKKHNISEPTDLPLLLESKNKSMVLLAIRLLTYYNNKDNALLLRELQQKETDGKISNEIELLLNKFE